MEMAHSIEGRPPFLDHELFSICSGLPMADKIHDGVEKSILRKSMHSILPQWMCDKPKHPFIAPPITSFPLRNLNMSLFRIRRCARAHVDGVPLICGRRVRMFLDQFAKAISN